MTLRSLGLVLAMVMMSFPAAAHAQDDIVNYSQQEVLGLTHAGLERWLVVGLGALWTGFAALQVWRIKRLDAA